MERIIKGPKNINAMIAYHMELWGEKPRYSEAFKLRVIRAYLERMSMWGIHRVFGVHPETLTRWLLEYTGKMPSLEDTLDKAHEDDVLELDELWSFVLKKVNKVWIWIAICRRTRQIVAYYVGDRSDKSLKKLWERIPYSYKRCLSFSDFYGAYQRVLKGKKHVCVDKKTGETAHVERWNNTLRQRLGRFVRKTLSFSKSIFFLDLLPGVSQGHGSVEYHMVRPGVFGIDNKISEPLELVGEWLAL